MVCLLRASLSPIRVQAFSGLAYALSISPRNLFQMHLIEARQDLLNQRSGSREVAGSTICFNISFRELDILICGNHNRSSSLWTWPLIQFYRWRNRWAVLYLERRFIVLGAGCSGLIPGRATSIMLLRDDSLKTFTFAMNQYCGARASMSFSRKREETQGVDGETLGETDKVWSIAEP